jgi:lysine-specific demethylase/histidyl-hydroxylase NO66
MLTLADVDHLLTESGIRTPALRVVREGTVLAEAAYTAKATLAGRPLTGLVDVRKALALYDAGATLVLQGLHRYWPPLTTLVSELEDLLGHPCQANAYLTPAGAQGFARHCDTHDVFVVQTVGTKHWLVESDGLPDELVLAPGQCLYLPTGTPHAAKAQQQLSLHVTIGVNQLTLRGLVHRSVAAALAAVPDEHLPAGFPSAPDMLTATLAQQLRALADRISAIDPAAATDREIRRIRSTRPGRLGGGLLDRAALAGLDDDTPLERRPGHPCLVRDDGDHVAVHLGDRVLTVPAWVRPALDQVCRAGTLTPSSLAEHLDKESRLVLCRRLIREGLLRIRS